MKQSILILSSSFYACNGLSFRHRNSEMTEMTNTTQRAVLIRAYGGANAAEVAQLPKPMAGPGQVLVRVRAAGVNGIEDRKSVV